MANASKPAIVAALAAGGVLTVEELRAAIQAPSAASVRRMANQLVVDGILEIGRRRTKLGPFRATTISIYRLRTARSLARSAA